MTSKHALRGIIRRMIYVFRIRKLLQSILEEYSRLEVDDDVENNQYPYMSSCVKNFRKRSKKFTPEVVSRLIVIATTDGYIRVIKYEPWYPSSTSSELDKIAVTGEGLKLLMPTGLLNALGGAVGKVAPLVAVIISLVALIVSILVAVLK